MNGVVPLLKPPGWTSQQAVNRVKHLLGARAGHAGTLDPDAAGVLPICVGRATRLAQYLMEAPKAYRFTACFGVATDTQDAAGNVVESGSANWLDASHVEGMLPCFRGEIEQVPPMFSAVKQEGQPLYKRARRGEVVERPARRVEVHTFQLLDWQGGDRPRALFDVTCSRGTYIRTLIDDLGRALGTVAHLTALLRRLAGGIEVAAALTPEEVAADPEAALQPPNRALAFLPAVAMARREVEWIRQGRGPVPAPGTAPGTVRCLDPTGGLVGVARVTPDGLLHIERLIV